MGSGLRQPFPWEGTTPTRQVAEALPEVVESDSTELRAAAKLVADPVRRDDRARRGAEGAAAWVHRELRKHGVDQPLSEVRDRVNRARAVTAAKRRK